MTDEDALIKATKNKGRSASVCFSTRSGSDRASVEAIGLSPPGTPPPTTAAAAGVPPKHARRAACRSQSARLTGGKSVRRRLPPTDRDLDVPDSPLSIKSGLSDPRLHDVTGSGTSSPVSFRRKGSARRVNSVHHSHNQRKSAAFLDIPKTQSNSNNQEADENSYRLRSFSFTTKGLVNRGDSFRRRHNRSNSVFPSAAAAALVDQQQQEALEQMCKDRVTNSPDTAVTTYNVSVIGTTGVGKTSLISQFMTSECINAYDRDRDGPSQQTVSIMLNGEESELCFHELKSSRAFHKKHVFDAFLIIYSVVDKSTFQQAEIELSKLQDANMLNTRPAILVGNKIDLARSRTVSPQDGKCLACTFRVKYIEISVGINHNVDELLVGILNQIRLKSEHVEREMSGGGSGHGGHHWYKSRGVMRASMKARQMFTWIFGREDSKFKNCENLHIL